MIATYMACIYIALILGILGWLCDEPGLLKASSICSVAATVIILIF
jgi:uncharacterized membrane protein